MSGFTAHHKRVVPAVFCISLFVVFGSLVFFLTPSTADAIAEQNAILLTISKAQQSYCVPAPDIVGSISFDVPYAPCVVPPKRWVQNTFEVITVDIEAFSTDLDTWYYWFPLGWWWMMLVPDEIASGVLSGPEGFTPDDNPTPSHRTGTFTTSWQMGPLTTKEFKYEVDDAGLHAKDNQQTFKNEIYVVLPNRSTVQWEEHFTEYPHLGDCYNHSVSHDSGAPIILPGHFFNKYIVQEDNWQLISVHGNLVYNEIRDYVDDYKASWDGEVEINAQGNFVSSDKHGLNRVALSQDYPSFLDGGVFILEQWWKVVTPDESNYLWRHHIEYHMPSPPSIDTYVFKTNSHDLSVFIGCPSHNRVTCSCW